MKILVSGNSGAGKSTLGKRLAKKYQLELYGLDKIVWKENWEKRSYDEKEELIKDILKKDSWIIEGITKSGLREADTIYFLDIPVYRCTFNVLKRFIKNGLGTRPDLPNNCPEYIGVTKSLKTHFIFHKVTRPFLLDKDLRKPGAKFIQVKSYRELEEVILNP